MNGTGGEGFVLILEQGVIALDIDEMLREARPGVTVMRPDRAEAAGLLAPPGCALALVNPYWLGAEGAVLLALARQSGLPVVLIGASRGRPETLGWQVLDYPLTKASLAEVLDMVLPR